MKRRLLLIALPCLVGAAGAQTRREQRAVYRCGNTLSDRPCEPEASASAVGFDRPSEADRRAAAERTRAERQRADRLEKDRLSAEREALRANAARPAPAPPKRKKPPPPAQRASG